MILITKSTTNTVNLSLYQKGSSSTAYFLFVFKGMGKTGQVLKCTSQANIVNWERYAGFSITEKTSPTLTASQIYFATPGLWNYEIYEKTVNTLTIPSTDPIETGMARVIGTSSTKKTYEPSTTISGYDPNN